MTNLQCELGWFLLIQSRLLCTYLQHLHIRIFLTEVPSAPVNIQLIGNESRTANITWQDGVSSNTSNPPADSYQVLLINDSRIDVFDVSTTSLFLDPLLPFTNYTITIVARNRIGFSNDSEPFSFVTNEERKLKIWLYVSIYVMHVQWHSLLAGLEKNLPV